MIKDEDESRYRDSTRDHESHAHEKGGRGFKVIKRKIKIIINESCLETT